VGTAALGCPAEQSSADFSAADTSQRPISPSDNLFIITLPLERVAVHSGNMHDPSLKGKQTWAGAKNWSSNTPLEEEVESIDVASDRRKIYTELGDPEVESLHGKFKRGRLIVQPDFQRQFVWDSTKASRLIESALLAIPIPVVYISQEQDNKEYVIDGQQRLTSFFSFIDGTFPQGTDFKLTGLKVFRELNGTKYRDLDVDLQDQIRYFKIRSIPLKRSRTRV
jgi:hypothetical protein